MCKVWNHTNLDCTYRNLVCVPSISMEHKALLELLDLSFNKLNVLPENAFSGLWKLRTLDLSYNFVSTFHKYSFAGLDSLQTLNLFANNISSIADAFSGLNSLTNLNLGFNPLPFLGDDSFIHFSSLKTLDLYNSISSICNDTFKGLDNLRSLDIRGISLIDIPPSPFHDLVSLQTLYVDVSVFFVISPILFTGLHHLIFLTITGASDFTTDTPFHQLSSVRHLELEIANCYFNENLFTGLQKLEFLQMTVTSGEPCNVNFGPLISLTNLTFYIFNGHAIISGLKDLETLNAPLQFLSLTCITYTDPEQIILNSTTFELWPQWKLNLQVFEIRVESGGVLIIEGSPFQWFPNLTGLCIIGQQSYPDPDLPNQTLSKEAFKGLENLEILRLQYFKINILTSDALAIFSKYNSLKVLNLAHNILDDYYKLDQICNLLSLELIDLSYTDHFTEFDCTLPNLTELYIGNNELKQTVSLYTIFKGAPNLKILNVDNRRWSLYVANVTFSNLVTLQSSKSHIFIAYDDMYITAPCLKELNFSHSTIFGDKPTTTIKILQSFRAPQLRTVDMIYNQISKIDEKDGKLLSTLKFLDLRNNQLTSPGIINLRHLQNIEVLLLGSNKIAVIPKPILQTLTALDTLDFCNNVLRCDCSVEAFRKWILDDEFVFLINNCSQISPDNNQYKCVSPDSHKGPSITQIDLDCESQLFKYISLGIACLVFVIIIVVVVVHYRWHIQYRLFLLFNRRNFQNILNNDDDVIDNNDIGDENGLPRYDHLCF